MKGKDWKFKQDGAPTHIARNPQEWVAANAHHFPTRDQWPPSIPDLNPCDCYLRVKLEKVVNNWAYDSISALKVA